MCSDISRKRRGGEGIAADAMVLNVVPGEIFAPNRTIGGVEVSATLDRHCGNE